MSILASGHSQPAPAATATTALSGSGSSPRTSRRDLARAAAILSVSTVLGNRPIVAARQTGHTLAQDVETGVDLHVPFNPFGQPLELHPHRAPNWGPFWVLLPHVWAGLLAFDENGSVVAELAETVEPNDTADVWTARLRADLAFASGNPITAQSFIDSWKRALDPERPAPMSTFMSLVQGYDSFVAGESTEIGFSAVDDATIEITLSEPHSSFPASLATFGWAVIDLVVADDPAAGNPALADAGAGLWRFTESVDGDHITMEPNPNSPLEPSPSIAKVTWRIVDGPDAAAVALDAYRQDAVAVADVPASHLAAVSGDDALAADLITIASQASTMAIGMDFLQPPFNDLRVRQAIAAAIDRDAWARDIQGGAFVPATGTVPPVVEITAGYDPASGIAFDPERARSLLAEAGIDPEQEAPDIVSYQAATDSVEEIERHAALLAMIAENSGLAIRHDTSLTADQIAALQQDNGGSQFALAWWWTVSDTPSILDTVGKSSSPQMAGRFNWSPELEGVEDQQPGAASEDFDELITAANATTDAGERNEAYRQAEQLLLDNAVYVPLGHWVQHYVQQPWLTGTRQGPWTGSIPVRFDADVVVQGRDAQAT